MYESVVATHSILKLAIHLSVVTSHYVSIGTIIVVTSRNTLSLLALSYPSALSPLAVFIGTSTVPGRISPLQEPLDQQRHADYLPVKNYNSSFVVLINIASPYCLRGISSVNSLLPSQPRTVRIVLSLIVCGDTSTLPRWINSLGANAKGIIVSMAFRERSVCPEMVLLKLLILVGVDREDIRSGTVVVWLKCGKWEKMCLKGWHAAFGVGRSVLFPKWEALMNCLRTVDIHGFNSKYNYYQYILQ